MPFGFTRQFLSNPFGIRGGFIVTHIDRAVGRPRNFVEPCPAVPRIASMFPEDWICAALRRDIFPPRVAPQRAIAVAPFVYETQVLLVRYVVGIDRESGNVHAIFLKFIVPAEWSGLLLRCARQPQRRDSSGYVDFVRGMRPGCWGRGNPGDQFALEGQLGQNEAQRFDVHQAMLDGNVKQAAGSGTLKTRIRWGEGTQSFVKGFAKSRVE